MLFGIYIYELSIAFLQQPMCRYTEQTNVVNWLCVWDCNRDNANKEQRGPKHTLLSLVNTNQINHQWKPFWS